VTRTCQSLPLVTSQKRGAWSRNKRKGTQCVKSERRFFPQYGEIYADAVIVRTLPKEPLGLIFYGLYLSCDNVFSIECILIKTMITYQVLGRKQPKTIRKCWWEPLVSDFNPLMQIGPCLQNVVAWNPAMAKSRQNNRRKAFPVEKSFPINNTFAFRSKKLSIVWRACTNACNSGRHFTWLIDGDRLIGNGAGLRIKLQTL